MLLFAGAFNDVVVVMRCPPLSAAGPKDFRLLFATDNFG